jgi:hypothetical protein
MSMNKAMTGIFPYCSANSTLVMHLGRCRLFALQSRLLIDTYNAILFKLHVHE